MTAFSLIEGHNDSHHLAWEIRTVNHRFLDINLTLPDLFKDQENTLRRTIQKKLSRGKVEARLRYTSGTNQARNIHINESLARALIVACRQIESLTNNQTEPVKAVDILQWPGVTVESEPETDSLIAHIRVLLDKALNELLSNREREGAALAAFIDQRCDQIAELIVKVRKRRPQIIEAMREKILMRIEELKLLPDTNRIEHEILLFSQRMDVEEELDRVMAHLDEINQVLERNEPIGRRLDFLMQELNREANTLASKSNDAETTQISIDLKVLIEQMREQVQNIE